MASGRFCVVCYASERGENDIVIITLEANEPNIELDSTVRT